jgi:hypothetical protein
MKKTLISGVVASLVTVSSLSAATVSANGYGDYLIAPNYFAYGDFKTDLKIANTSDTKSVVVRGVVRESENSNEIDFIILLTPGDVWSASISPDESGNAVLFSDDDSNYGRYTTIGTSRSENLQVNLTTANNKGKTFNAGYVEFYPIAEIEHDADEATGFTLEEAPTGTLFSSVTHTPIHKQLVANVYESMLGYEDLDATDATETVYTKTYQISTTATATVTVTEDDISDVDNVLTGEVTVTNSTMKADMSLPMLAVQDASVDTDRLTTVSVGSSAANPFYPGVDTNPDLYLINAADASNVSVVKDALKVNTAAVFFNNYGSSHQVLMTFPQDHRATPQLRNYNYIVRGETECLCSCTVQQTTTVNPSCPSCNVTTVETDVISGDGATASAPAATTASDTAGLTGEVAIIDVAALTEVTCCSDFGFDYVG